MLPQRQPPPPPPAWTGAAAPQGPASHVAPWAVASERLNTFTTTQLVDDERGLVPVARFAVRDAGRLLPRHPSAAASEREPAAVRGTPVPDRLGRRAERRPDAGVPRNEQRARRRSASWSDWPRWWRWSSPASGNTVRRRPGAPSAFRPAPPRPGASAVGSYRSSTCGCPTRPCATASRPTTRTGHACCVGGSHCSLAGFLTSTAGAFALFSTGAALVLAVPAALASLAVIAWAPGIVLAIAASHQEALAKQTEATGVVHA